MLVLACGGNVLLLEAAGIGVDLALHSLLAIVEACIGRTDLWQQVWMGEGAIVDGTRQVGMTADDVEEGGLFRSQQQCDYADVPYRTLAKIGRHEV